MASRQHLTSMQKSKRLSLSQVGSSSVILVHLFKCLNEIIEFYFNFPSSIFGELVPSVSSQSRPLPYRHFLATPLLPCGDADPKIKKFTGNDELGKAKDDMTKAIHAFAHFSVVYSHQNLLFCDLQGIVICHPSIFSHSEEPARCSRYKQYYVSDRSSMPHVSPDLQNLFQKELIVNPFTVPRIQNSAPIGMEASQKSKNFCTSMAPPVTKIGFVKLCS